jgi:hypothetical protein
MVIESTAPILGLSASAIAAFLASSTVLKSPVYVPQDKAATADQQRPRLTAQPPAMDPTALPWRRTPKQKEENFTPFPRVSVKRCWTRPRKHMPRTNVLKRPFVAMCFDGLTHRAGQSNSNRAGPASLAARSFITDYWGCEGKAVRLLWWATTIVLLLPLGGCFADREQQLALCKIDVLHPHFLWIDNKWDFTQRKQMEDLLWFFRRRIKMTPFVFSTIRWWSSS